MKNKSKKKTESKFKLPKLNVSWLWNKFLSLRLRDQFLTFLAVFTPIAAIVGGVMWFYNTYYLFPWELYIIWRQGTTTLEGLEILPGYLDIETLPEFLEERKNTVDIIKMIMEEKNFQMYDLVALAKCESTLNPNALNKYSYATGLFQYKAMTWGTTPYCDKDIWDPEYQTLATIWMFEHNRYTEWECFHSYLLKSKPPYTRDYHGCGKQPE